MSSDAACRWRPMGATVRGARHARRGVPNEDAFELSEPGPVAGIAVADGHGDRRVTRAALGARIAAELGLYTLTGVLRRWTPPEPRTVAEELINAWRRQVDQDFRKHPPTREERALVGEPVSDDQIAGLYGTTLLAAVADQRSLIVCRIGDGDLGVVYGEGELQLPVGPAPPATPYTASMALPGAAGQLRLAVVDLTGSDEVLVWACTDGLAAAQPDPGWRVAVGRGLSAHRRRYGVDDLAARLPEWLRPIAEAGGDDTTMAVLTRAG